MLIFWHLDDGAAGSGQFALERPQQRAPDRLADNLFIDECGKQANDDDANPAPPTDLGGDHPYEFLAGDGYSSEDVSVLDQGVYVRCIRGRPDTCGFDEDFSFPRP